MINVIKFRTLFSFDYMEDRDETPFLEAVLLLKKQSSDLGLPCLLEFLWQDITV